MSLQKHNDIWENTYCQWYLEDNDFHKHLNNDMRITKLKSGDDQIVYSKSWTQKKTDNQKHYIQQNYSSELEKSGLSKTSEH